MAKIRNDNPFFEPQLYGKCTGKHSVFHKGKTECSCAEKRDPEHCLYHEPKFCKLHRKYVCKNCGKDI